MMKNDSFGMHKDAAGIYRISLFSNLPVIAGYSQRGFGDLRLGENRQKFVTAIGRESGNLIMARQIHGVQVPAVTRRDGGRTLDEADGLVYADDKAPVILGVTFADCVPILAVDPVARIIGVAHAGWRGTLSGIAGELIHAMSKLGAAASNIYASIGPHIGMCCYSVTPDRVGAFQEKFGRDQKIAARFGTIWHLDIGYVNLLQLFAAGIQKDHIDAPITCTSCQVAEFNSFRKDSKATFGVQLGIIGFT